MAAFDPTLHPRYTSGLEGYAVASELPCTDQRKAFEGHHIVGWFRPQWKLSVSLRVELM